MVMGWWCEGQFGVWREEKWCVKRGRFKLCGIMWRGLACEKGLVCRVTINLLAFFFFFFLQTRNMCKLLASSRSNLGVTWVLQAKLTHKCNITLTFQTQYSIGNHIATVLPRGPVPRFMVSIQCLRSHMENDIKPFKSK